MEEKELILMILTYQKETTVAVTVIPEKMLFSNCPFDLIFLMTNLGQKHP